jgi:hypothetical protein
MFPFAKNPYVRRMRIINGKEYDYVASRRTREDAMISMDILRNKGFKCRMIKQKSEYFGDAYDIFCSR